MVFPELVTMSEYKSVNYNGLIGVLIEAIKELKSEVDVLKGKIINIIGNSISVETSDGMIFNFSEAELVRIDTEQYELSKFSDINNEKMHECILNIFKVNSEVNLFEAYTEFWALIIHTIFCSFYLIQDKHNINLFLKTAANLIYIERSYSFFQMVKILDYMGIKYNNLHSTDNISVTLKDMCYKDKTNVLCYYIIKLVLLDNYQDFFMWCLENNINLLMFNIDETTGLLSPGMMP